MRFEEARREDVPADELEDWDAFTMRIEAAQAENASLPAHRFRHRIAGGFRGLYWSPPLLQALNRTGRAMMAQQGKAGSFLPLDHEMIDLVLAFDSGHWGLLANHVPYAAASGMSVSSIRSLRDGRLGELPPDERELVEFIRAIRDGGVTDDMWAAMERRFGSTRGAVEYTFFVTLLMTHQVLIMAFDEVQILPDELEEMLASIEDGTWSLPVVTYHGQDPDLQRRFNQGTPAGAWVPDDPRIGDEIGPA